MRKVKTKPEKDCSRDQMENGRIELADVSGLLAVVFL